MYKDKKIFILGLARSGYEVAKLLAETNDITLVDNSCDEELQKKELENLCVKVFFGEFNHLFDDSFDVLIKNPGIKNYHPVIKKAKELNIAIVNEVEVAYHYLPKNIDIIGITGTNGKTTTSTLIYEVLKQGNRNVHLCGNIGFPLSSFVNKIKENDILVIEISNYQLYNFKDFKTNISVLVNLSPAHLDFHNDDYNDYINTKKKIFNNHNENDIAIINLNDKDSQTITKDIKSNKIYFSNNKETDIYLNNNDIIYKDEIIINTENILLKGIHNYQNIMCAIIVGKHFNIDKDKMNEVFKSFKGVEHRIEYVTTINNVKYYNDSKSTNNTATITALSSFADPIILLLGGLDRGQTFDDLLPYMNNVKQVITYGETKNKIKAFCNNNNIKCEIQNNLKESTIYANKIAVPNDIVLLSPACASWDQYKCFEDRGEDYKNIIETLK